MTRDEIIRMAREADSGFEGGPDADGTMPDSLVGINAIERFARAAYAAGAAAEREALAVAVRFADNGTEAAEIIRARGEK